MQTKQKKDLRVSDARKSTLGHETAKSSTKIYDRFKLERLLDKLRFSTPEERLKSNYYRIYFIHEIKGLERSFHKYRIPALCKDYITWTLQVTDSIKRLEACYKADLLMLKVLKPKTKYQDNEFEILLRMYNSLHSCLSNLE